MSNCVIKNPTPTSSAKFTSGDNLTYSSDILKTKTFSVVQEYISWAQFASHPLKFPEYIDVCRIPTVVINLNASSTSLISGLVCISHEIIWSQKDHYVYGYGLRHLSNSSA